MSEAAQGSADRDEKGPDWSAYYLHTAGREPRPIFAKAMQALEADQVAPGLAVEIGFGDGTETLALLRLGWRVVAIDPTPEAAARLRASLSEAAASRLEIRTDGAETVDLPPFDFLYAGYALSFIAPGAFDAFWARLRSALRPGGHLGVNIFGVRDTWADNPAMTFVTRATVDDLVRGLEVIAIDEEDADGPAFSGPKHWHLFDILARRALEDGG